jgi:hypothetical protein
MKTIQGGDAMSNLQIKGIDEGLYNQLKQLAADENRSVSQQVLFLIRNHLARKRRNRESLTAAQTLLSLAGSWDDSRSADQIIQEIKGARRSSRKLSDGF